MRSVTNVWNLGLERRRDVLDDDNVRGQREGEMLRRDGRVVKMVEDDDPSREEGCYR